MKYQIYWLVCVLAMQGCKMNDEGSAKNDDVAWGLMILGGLMFMAGLEKGTMLAVVGAIMFLIGCN